MTVALSVAVGQGAEAVVCASTGNTSASMAAYAARAKVKPLVLVPQGKIAAGKLAQAIVHGAQVIMVRGNFDDCLRMSRELAEHYPVALVNSVNPYRLEGQKTAAFEIVDFLGDAPDVHVLPVGNAGNISAYWKGYTEYADAGLRLAPPDDDRLAGRGRLPAGAGRPRWPRPRRWPRPSGSATRPPGTSRSPRPSSPAVASAPSATRRSSPPSARSPPPRASSSSPGSAAERGRAAPGRRRRRRLLRQDPGRHRHRARAQGHRHRAVDLHRPRRQRRRGRRLRGRRAAGLA